MLFQMLISVPSNIKNRTFYGHLHVASLGHAQYWFSSKLYYIFKSIINIKIYLKYNFWNEPSKNGSRWINFLIDLKCLAQAFNI
jgi:hypothetical protein